MSSGRSNSPTMHSGIAPPHGLQLSILRSIRNVSIPPLASVSAAAPPAGPPPITATRRLRPATLGLVLAARTWNLLGVKLGFDWEVKLGFSRVVWRSPMKDLRAMEAIFGGGVQSSEE